MGHSPDRPGRKANRRTARALVDKGAALMERGRDGDALAYFDEVIERFGAASEIGLREQAARAFVKRGCALGELNRFAEAEAAFDTVIASAGGAAEPALRDQFVLALYNKAFYLARGGQFVDALHTCAALLNPFTDVEPPRGMRAVVADGILLAASVAVTMGDLEPAVRLYDELVARFRDDDAPEVQVAVTSALTSKATTLGRLGTVEQAIATYDDLLALLGERSQPELRARVAEALCSRGYWLEELGRKAEALAAYRDVIDRFDDDENEPIARQLNLARVGRDRLSA